MKISKKNVLNTAELARLEFDEETLSKFVRQLGDILVHIEDLAELDTENIEPTSHVLDLSTPFRKDEVIQSITREEALRNASSQENGFFTVPKIIINLGPTDDPISVHPIIQSELTVLPPKAKKQD